MLASSLLNEQCNFSTIARCHPSSSRLIRNARLSAVVRILGGFCAKSERRLLHHNHLGRKKSDESRGTRKLFIISKRPIVNLSSPCLVSCANNNAFAAVLCCRTRRSSSSNRRIKYSSCKTYGRQETPRHPPRFHLHIANFSRPKSVCVL